MKVLYVTPNASDPLAFYRGSGVLRRMRTTYGMDYTPVEAVSWAIVAAHDLVFMQRPFSEQHAEVMEICKQQGVPVVTDFDDWLYGLMPDNPAYTLYNKCKPHLDNAARLSGEIMVSTEHMKRMYAADGVTNVVVIPNAYDTQLFTPADAADRNKIVLWRGGSSHTQDQLSVRDGWQRLVDQYRDWQFIFINCPAWWLKGEYDSVKFIEGMNVFEYMAALKTLKPAIMTHPLLDSDFNRCKSMCSYIEAAHAGAAFVGPDFEEFERPGCTRYKPGDSDSFYNAMSGLIENPHRIIENALLAQAEIQSGLSLRRVNEIRWDVFTRQTR